MLIRTVMSVPRILERNHKKNSVTTKKKKKYTKTRLNKTRIRFLENSLPILLCRVLTSYYRKISKNENSSFFKYIISIVYCP